MERLVTLALLASEAVAWVIFAARHGTIITLACASVGIIAALFLARLALHRVKSSPLSADLILRKISLALAPAWLLFLDLLPATIMLRKTPAFLFLLASTGSSYLLAVAGCQHSRKGNAPAWDNESPERSDPRSRQRSAFLVFLATLAAYSLSLWTRLLPALPFSGDEPHYLLITQSIVRDGDLNLYNNYQNGDYLEFYPNKLGYHAYPGKKGATNLYSKHMPALPLLLVPAYWCGEQLEKLFGLRNRLSPPGAIKITLARQTMAILTALLATVLFLMIWEITGSRRKALYAWLLFAFSLPILAYSRLLYSEIPAALILLLVLHRAVFSGLNSRSSFFWTGVGIALLPWFGIKYLVLATAALALALAANWKAVLRPGRGGGWLFVPLFFSGALFIAFLLQVFGTVSPFAIYNNFDSSNVTPVIHGIRFKPATFFSTALAYLLDQRIGIFIYAPIYILFIPGILLLLRRFNRQGSALLFITVVIWIFHALLNFRQGHNPPGRPLLTVVPLLALFAAGALTWAKSRAAQNLFRILVVLTVLLALVSLWHPQLLFHEGLSSETWNHDTQAQLLTRYSIAGIDFSRWVPNLVFLPRFSWIVLGLWLAALAIISMVILKKEPASVDCTSPRRLTRHLAGVFTLSLFLAFHHAFDVHLDAQKSLAGNGYAAYFQDDNIYGGEKDGFWTRGNCRTEVALHSSARLKRLHLELTSRVPLGVTVRLGSRIMTVRSQSRERFNAVFHVRPEGGKPWKRGYLYLLRFQVVGGFVPAGIDPQSTDRRHLGLFIRIAVD